MTDEILKLIEYRLSQAEETLMVAKELSAKEHYRDAVNRAYYAMFYCALGLLAVKNLGSSKHSGVLSLFSRHFVKTGMFSGESGSYLRQAFELRQKCDYREFVNVEKAEVEEILRNAAEFINQSHLLVKEIQK